MGRRGMAVAVLLTHWSCSGPAPDHHIPRCHWTMSPHWASVGTDVPTLGQCWASHPCCGRHSWYSTLTHWSPACKALNMYHRELALYCEPDQTVFVSQMCHYDALMGRRGAEVTALLMYWSYYRPAPNHQCAHQHRAASELLFRRWANGQPSLLMKMLLTFFIINPLIPSV